MSNHKTFYGLPETVKFCKLCVISNQRPSSTVEFKNKNTKKHTILFGDDGICSACNYNSIKNDINWQKREEELYQFLEKYRRTDGSYDCIIPSSGGKDSSFTAHIVKYKYGMNPLTVTWAPNMFTQTGWNNLQSLATEGGIDNILYTPNGRLHRYLTRQAFLNLGHPFQPFIHGQKIIGPLMALKFNVPLIIYGENQAEYGNKVEDNFEPKMDPSFFTCDNPKDMILGGISVEEILQQGQFSQKELAPYLPLKKEEIESNELNKIFLGYFERWDPQECYYYAAEHTGFQAAPERSEGTYSKYTEIDDKIVPFHFFTTFIKFGIGRATYDASQEIRNSKITREEGVALVSRYDHEFPERWYEDFLDYLSIDDNIFWKTIDLLRSPHLWKKEDRKWKLRHNVALTGCDDVS